PHLGAARRAGWQRGMADRLAAGHRYRLARPRRLGRRLHDRLGRADGELAGRPAAHRRLADAGTDRRRGPGTPVAGRAGPRLRTAPRARGAQRVPGPARGVRARLPPAPAADPPLQPQRPDPASGAGGTPGGLAVSDPNTETTGTPDTGPDRARGIDDLLEQERAGYTRVRPQAADEAARAGAALLVDIRYAALRERDGLIPGAVVVERNELEWRLDPTGSHRLPEATGHDLRVVVVCNEGYASSLAAESLHRLGLCRATDLVGGFQAWRAAGLPVEPPRN